MCPLDLPQLPYRHPERSRLYKSHGVLCAICHKEAFVREPTLATAAVALKQKGWRDTRYYGWVCPGEMHIAS